MIPRAWLVVAKDGFEAVFKDRANAERYAVATHGILMPLYASVPCQKVYKPPERVG